MKNEDPKLSAEDITYVADMLRAIVWVKDDLLVTSPEALKSIEDSLSIAEASLRHLAAEMEVARQT